MHIPGANAPHIADLELWLGERHDPFDVRVTYRVSELIPAHITADPYYSTPEEGGEVDVERVQLFAGPAPDKGWNAIGVTEGQLAELGLEVDPAELYDEAMGDDGPDPDDAYDRYRDEGF